MLVQKKIKAVYTKVGNDMVRIRPDGWKPWANTILNITMNWDTTDHSLTPNPITTQWTISYTTLSSWQKVLNCNGSVWVRTTNKLPASTNTKYTLSVWVKSSWTYWVDRCVVWHWYDNGCYWFKFSCSWNSNSYRLFYWWGNNSWYWISEWYSAISTSSFDLMTYVIDWNKIIRYKNWSYVSQWTYSANINTNLARYLSIWWDFGYASSYSSSWNTSRYFYWQIWEVILESKVRTAEEITSYYNLTKSKYWL